MQLFYSGAIQPGKVQSDPSKSLGGFISGSLIANGGLNNIFPPINREQVKSLSYDVRLIVLKNTAGYTVNNVRLWTNRGVYTTYKIAGVSPAVDACSRQVFESLQSGNTIPYQASLSSHEAEVNALIVGNLVNNAIIGIWIQRELDSTQFTELDGLQGVANLTCQQMEDLLTAASTNPTVYDQGQLVIDWS